jgi:hypothetical protein
MSLKTFDYFTLGGKRLCQPQHMMDPHYYEGVLEEDVQAIADWRCLERPPISSRNSICHILQFCKNMTDSCDSFSSSSIPLFQFHDYNQALTLLVFLIIYLARYLLIVLMS